MHISQARPAEKFYRIPMAVHRVLISDDLGKGEAMTLLRLTAYLWSSEPVEGSRAEWAAALGIEAQTFEAHVPALGRAGCLSYIQPHVGYYCFYGLAQSDAEVQRLRTAWGQAAAEWEQQTGQSRRLRYVWQTARVEALKNRLGPEQASKLTLDATQQASKVTLSVVDTSSSVLNVLEDRAEQASKVTLDEGFSELLALYEQEIGGTITAMLADEFRELWMECGDIARWREAFRASIGAGNRWRYVKAIILHPERKPPAKEEWNNGKYAGSRKSTAPADASPDGASADIAAWFARQ